jgi:hypothetical protein
LHATEQSQNNAFLQHNNHATFNATIMQPFNTTITQQSRNLLSVPGMSAGQVCRASLPGKSAGQVCRASLPGKSAGQVCQASLPGKSAG